MTDQNPSDQPPKAEPSTKKVFIIDDDETILDMVKTTLETEGFKTVMAQDAKNIVARTIRFAPHLIISDVMMPGGGGYDLLRTLQTDNITRKIPVIVMTGANLDKSTRDMIMMEPNVKAFFPKPFNPTNMLEKVHKILNTVSSMDKLMQKHRNETEDFDPDRFGGFH